jgi:hypothetical protein
MVPVWLSFTTTLAPGTAAPVGSVTTPEMVPRNSCARAEFPAIPATISPNAISPGINLCDIARSMWFIGVRNMMYDLFGRK